MKSELFEILRCPYCGGAFDLVESLFHRAEGDEIRDGILGCQCCIFPVVDGIPVLHLQPNATMARDLMQAGQPDAARRAMIGLETESEAEAFEATARSETATYRETVEALGPNFEGGYFLYRFSDPTYVVAQSVVRSVAKTVLAPSTRSGRTDRRAIDICGGSGHLTRSLLDLSTKPPVLADLYFAKMWLARRFTAPGCEPVCCDGNAPMPFARGAFAYAMCTDAFMYIWTKRQFVGEMARLVDDPASDPGAVVIGHTHNERTWSPSHGQPLSPEGYAALFETLPPRVFGESSLFADVVAGGPLDLTRRETAEALDREPALTIVATTRADVFARHPLDDPPAAGGEFHVNPLYVAEPEGDRVKLRLRFPSEDYADEYGACRQYLPDEVVVHRAAYESLPGPAVPPAMADLARRRVVLNLPRRYT
ncbi:MAG TPA: hypothetical protein VFA27_03640 [Vicinamibacterales bacterium]|nr:hypothetical protein [Vicinamibacterales bacterium]